MGPITPDLYSRYCMLDAARKGTVTLSREHKSIYLASRRNAKTRKIDFRLSLKGFAVLVARSAGRCEMTSIRFNDLKPFGGRIRPFRMSLDRLDNEKGYYLHNCRLICARANLARGTADLEEIHHFMLEYARHHGANIPNDLVLSRHDDMWLY